MSAPGTTPGPWRVDDEHDTDAVSIVGRPAWKARRFGVDGEWDVCNVEQDTADSKANARLIAAAPDLYDALEALLKQTSASETVAAIYGAHAALAKARGEQS